MLDLLKTINDDYSQAILAIVAIISLIYIYREFEMKHRPYVVPEISLEKSDNGSIFFNAILVNKGEKPGVAKISKALLLIGDDEYPTDFNIELVLSPNEKSKVSPIGHITDIGIKKIIGHEYSENRVEIYLEVESKSLGDKKFKYRSVAKFRIDISGPEPIVRLLEEQMI